MLKVTYLQFGSIAHFVEVSVGLSFMRGPVNDGVPDIDADCCATWHEAASWHTGREQRLVHARAVGKREPPLGLRR
jgi:hypothetical protein